MKITAGQVMREAVVVIGGAVVAALIIGQLPGLRAWIASQWADAPRLE